MPRLVRRNLSWLSNSRPILTSWSRTPKKSSRERFRKGYDLRNMWYAISFSAAPLMVMATSWLASTVRGFSLTLSASSSPAMALRVTTMLSAISSGSVATMAPSVLSPTRWPALPIRWISLETWRGELYWMAKSTEPTSMPSSRDEVQISPFSCSALNCSSMSTRMSLDREPWCTPTLKFSSHTRYLAPSASAVSRVLTNNRVERCSSMRSLHLLMPAIS